MQNYEQEIYEQEIHQQKIRERFLSLSKFEGDLIKYERHVGYPCEVIYHEDGRGIQRQFIDWQMGEGWWKKRGLNDIDCSLMDHLFKQGMEALIEVEGRRILKGLLPSLLGFRGCTYYRGVPVRRKR